MNHAVTHRDSRTGDNRRAVSHVPPLRLDVRGASSAMKLYFMMPTILVTKCQQPGSYRVRQAFCDVFNIQLQRHVVCEIESLS